MTDRKISELVAVTTVEDTDEFVVARAGASNKITGANLKAAAGGGSQSGGSQIIFQSTPVPLTHAQILALDSEPVEVVPAQGAGTLIVPIAAVYTADLTVAYTGGGRLVFVLDAANNWNEMTNGLLAPNVLGSTFATIAVDGGPFLSVVPAALNVPAEVTTRIFGTLASGWLDSPLSLALQSSAIVDGDPANTLTVTVLYTVVTVT